MNAIDRLEQAAYEMYHALMVVTKDPNIKSFLSNLDPHALKQCEDSIQVYINRNNREWMADRYERLQDEAYEL